MSKSFSTGSVKELWKVSFPMMVTFFSLSLMMFVDRIFLSWYSGQALSAAVTSGTLAWAFIAGVMTLAAMSEVFVSQFNGAKKYRSLGRPVWQMIYLCGLSFLFFIPAALFIAPLVFPAAVTPLENAYFSFFMYTGPFFCIHSALAGFFIGRGDAKIIQWMAIISNLVNAVLDPILIFGIDGVIPSFGMMGAAYATLTGALVQAGVVFYFFLKKKHHNEFETRKKSFDRKLFLSCLKVGIPPAIFVFIELVGWTIFYLMMKGISEQHILIAGVCQSILILFFFVGWGLEKGCVALAGNFIGQKKNFLVNRVLKSAFVLIGIFSTVTGIVLLGFDRPIVNWFLDSPLAASEFSSEAGSGLMNIEETKSIIQSALIFVLFTIILENVRWVINGVLTAAGDTLFLLISGTISLWVFCLLPTYFFIYLPKAPILYAYGIQVFYGLMAAMIVYGRFLQGKWKTKKIVDDDEPQEATIEVKEKEPVAVSNASNEQPE